MKALLATLGLFLVCALLVFAAPHHLRVEGRTNPRTLGEIYTSMVKEAYTHLFISPTVDLSSRGATWLVLLSLAAMLAAVFPVLFIGLTLWWPLPDTRRIMCVVAGTAAMTGAGVNFAIMLLSGMSFGFGASNSTDELTPFIWITPAFQAVFGLMSIVTGCSVRFAAWLNHWLLQG